MTMPANRSKRRRSDDVDYSSNHPSAPSVSVASEKKETESSGLLETLQRHIDDLRNHIYCGVCIKPLYEPYTLPCGHTFCYSCLVQWFTSQGQSKTCPDCRSPVKSIPAPAYLVRNIVHMFIGRSELTDANETTHEHLANQVAETERVEKDKKNTDPKTGGLFQGCFNKIKAPIRDNDEGVTRCPGCFWELEDGECMHCGYTMSDSDQGLDYDDDLDDIEELENILADNMTEEEDDDDDDNFVLGDDRYGQFGFNYHSDQPFMDTFGGDESMGDDSIDGSSSEEASAEEDTMDEESNDSADDSESSHSTVHRASNGRGSSVAEAETSSAQGILSSDRTEADSDEDPIRRPSRRRNARSHQLHQQIDLSVQMNGVRMHLRGQNGAVARSGTDPLNALVINDSSPPRPATRPRRASPGHQ
ncbi:RING finger domain-containing protein [Microsporum canis CBS 113480]|uniref:RING finger domain-containing protein n=1 Tax=Arthroderma otae (strain ATCC MYA-4605 / CBS 113480) TaxID=554155 RepID=C5FXX8_ARTOC|nr:RING finger domain-containing protein [Microsporum canis CBS 113480]EEQ34376.1 RING finger domain-containing protein [Microsporum canis CBS 113480]